jgi:hypothetical protein
MNTTLSKKYPTLDQEKKAVYLEGSIHNPLQSKPLVTPHSPFFLPLLEAFLESFFWKTSQLLRRILHDVPVAVKTGTLQWRLQFGEQPEITWSHVWSVGSLANNWNAVFGQEPLDQV